MRGRTGKLKLRTELDGEMERRQGKEINGS